MGLGWDGGTAYVNRVDVVADGSGTSMTVKNVKLSWIMRSVHIQNYAWHISTSIKHHYGASYQFRKVTRAQFLFDSSLSMEIMCANEGYLQN
jgi:hypothetical protein